jgi:hypothetical protein
MYTTWLINFSLVLLIIIYLFRNFCLGPETEHFVSEKHLNLKRQLDLQLDEDIYMNFLSDIDQKLNLNKENKNEFDVCDNKIIKKVQKKALNEAFEKIQAKNTSCVYKAIHLSEFTNPMFYLADRTTFPPRWLVKTYKDIPLPKTVNLKQWTNMYNCCKAGN